MFESMRSGGDDVELVLFIAPRFTWIFLPMTTHYSLVAMC